MRIGMAQINPTVGDIEGNTQLVLKTLEDAAKKSCDLVIFPELTLTGYPPEDLLLKPGFVKDNLAALNQLARHVKNIVAIVGFVDLKGGKRYNAAAWLEKGKVAGIYRKNCLPNYGVFDEKRYFEAASEAFARDVKGFRVGLTICEDVWIKGPHLKMLMKKNPDIVVNLSASPFHAGKLKERVAVVKSTVGPLKRPLIYCNAVGGQDELVFDGGSFVMGENGRVLDQAPQFSNGLFSFEVTKNRKKLQWKFDWKAVPELPLIEEVLWALVLGTRDYVQKNGFGKVTLGLSGGIDSALVAAIAVQALGHDRVVGVTMPSQYSSNDTRSDAHLVAKNLKIQMIEIPIQATNQEFLKALAPQFAGREPNFAEENLQARIRGTLLMALSNKFGWLVLTTSNKSEMSTGYSTLYGDAAGGFAVLKDVLKTTVYELARLINSKAGREIIPQTTIDRAPTAELRENQKDEDSLGPYTELDPVVMGYVEKNLSFQELSKQRPNKSDYIRKILGMVDRAEYKRRQGPPGVKITPRSFGRDHRMPITNRYTPKP